MKINYLLASYDDVFRNTISPTTNFKKSVFEVLSNHEQNSFLVFEIEIDKNTGNLKISSKNYSLHPQAQTFEMKSILHFNEFMGYLPELKSIIEFTGENIYIAKHPQCGNKFFAYEKCPVAAIPIKKRYLLYTHQVLQKENHNIKRAIKEQVFKHQSNAKIEHFIRKVQLALESQLHLLIKHIAPKTKKELYEYSHKMDKIDCLKCQFYHLDKLLMFLEREYAAYLDNKLMVPYSTVLLEEVEIASTIAHTRNSLLVMVIEKELLQIIFAPLLPLSNLHAHEKISYHQYNYAKNYALEIAKFIAENPKGCSASQWCLWLVEMQMNTFEFFDFSTNMLKKEFINCESEAALLELLFHYLKWYNHSKSKPGVSYQENFPEIKFQMYNWLEEEIEFLSRKKELATKIEVRNENTANQEKILVDLSVAQLAYGIKILIEGGFIKTNNVKHVLRVAARVLKTKITESISEDSLRSKFYEIETSTYLEVHEKIKKILNFTKL